MSDFTDDFMRDIPRGVSSRYLKQQAVPQARFQEPEKILNSQTLDYDPENPGSKILMGAIGNKLIGIEDNRHIFTVGGNRSGKSVSLINNLLLYPGSTFNIDIKAELANITAERRNAMGQKVCVLDPYNYASDRIAKYRSSYNPMAGLNENNPTVIEDASLIADAMVVQSPNDKDPHWDESAKNFIEGIILHVATDPRYEGRRHLVTIRDLIIGAMEEEA